MSLDRNGCKLLPVAARLFFLFESCSCPRRMCSSCHTANGAHHYVVMQADTQAPHLNAKNRMCVFVCLDRIKPDRLDQNLKPSRIHITPILTAWLNF